MDWQMDMAVELGILTDEQATEEMQTKLERFGKYCIDNYSYARESQVDCYPSRILEDEHNKILGDVRRAYSHDTGILECRINELNDIIHRKNQYIYDLKKQLERKGV